MSWMAIGLVLAAAVVHASWNLLSKQASAVGGAAFVWLVAACSSALYAVPAIVLITLARPHVTPVGLLFLVGTSVLHAGYFVVLQHGYRHGDLSVVYPLARGTGPLLSGLAAIWLFSEDPGVLGVAGILLVAVGVATLSLPGRTAIRPTPQAIAYGLLCGVLIASYTLWDKYAVAGLALPAILVQWSSEVGRAVLLAPVAARRRDELRLLWRDYRRQVLGTAILSPLAYVLVLFAMVTAPVSAVAPLREVSVLIAVVLGGRLLAEGDLRRRLPAAAAIAIGVVAIALYS